ncbi:MAG TPA: helix-turn-helix transcriptional regulator [Pseudonocardiaceae bacterium]
MSGAAEGDLPTRADVRDFLVSRRARISPDEVGLPSSGRRRVAGLRREEVAVLAGVSIEWYTRLEKGHVKGVSEDVLEAVARALRLDDGERAYLLDLARAARAGGRLRGTAPEPLLPPNIQWLLNSMTLSAAVVINGRQDILAVNPLARALYSPVFDSSASRDRGHPNLARFHFTDPGAREFSGNWDATADILVASLRAAAGRNPREAQFQDLIAELSAASPEFRDRWSAHNILASCHGTKIYRHPDVGELSLDTQSMRLPITDQEVELMCATAKPASAAEDKLKLLASWRHPSDHSPNLGSRR